MSRYVDNSLIPDDSEPATTSDDFMPGPRLITKRDFLEADGVPTTKLPYFLNPFAVQNAAIITGAFNIGISLNFLTTPVTYYLITACNVSATQYSAFIALKAVPTVFKFAFGMLSDEVPLMGYRRKSWFIIGWLGFIAVMLWLAFTMAPDANMIIGLYLFAIVLFNVADVANDSMLIERVRWENAVIKGSAQTSYYTIRTFGGVLGALLGALLYNTSTWGWGLSINQCFLLAALVPLMTVMPPFPLLEELVSRRMVPSLSEQFDTLWQVVQLRAVYQVAGYIYFYGIFQIPNGAFSTFLIDGLGFSDFQYGMLSVAARVLSWLGLVLYRACFFDSSWQNIYIGTTLISVVFGIINIFLILRLNLNAGIPDFYFALGGKISILLEAIQFMPSCIMFAMLCPMGSEGFVYAALTVVSTVAYTVAANIGSSFTLIWDVSNQTIAGGDYTGVLNLAILTTCLSVVPLGFVWLLPDSKDELRKLANEGGSSHVGGATLLAVVGISLVTTIVISIVFIWDW